MAHSNISIRIDDSVKKQFDVLCEEFGLTMSTAINMFVKAVVREKRIPFELSVNIPNVATRKAIEDAENNIGLSAEYHSVDDVMKAMLDED